MDDLYSGIQCPKCHNAVYFVDAHGENIWVCSHCDYTWSRPSERTNKLELLSGEISIAKKVMVWLLSPCDAHSGDILCQECIKSLARQLGVRVKHLGN